MLKLPPPTITQPAYGVEFERGQLIGSRTMTLKRDLLILCARIGFNP